MIGMRGRGSKDNAEEEIFKTRAESDMQVDKV